MRLGKVVGTTTPKETPKSELASMMVGRSVELVVNKDPTKPGPAVLSVEDLTVERRAGADGRRPRLARGARRRDRRPGRRPGQRPDRARRAITGLRRVTSGSIVLAGRDITRTTRRRGSASRHRQHPRGPPGRRARAVDVDCRQPRARRLRPDAVRPLRCPRPRPGERERRAQAEGVRHPGYLGRGTRPDTFRGQPAKGRRRPRAVPADDAARRLAADSRARRRLDRVRPPPDHRTSATGGRGAARLVRARRGAGARRPDRRHVPGRIVGSSTRASGANRSAS